MAVSSCYQVLHHDNDSQTMIVIMIICQIWADFMGPCMDTVATPKQIRELMKVDGLTNDEVKSHLQVTN